MCSEEGQQMERLPDRWIAGWTHSRQSGEGLKQVRVGWPVCLQRSCADALIDRLQLGVEMRAAGSPHTLLAGVGNWVAAFTLRAKPLT